jgi:hypothetical protein
MSTTIIEVDENGTLRVPAAILPQSAPHTRYTASLHGQQVILAPTEAEEPFWKKATPEERAADILRWAASHIDGPGLPDKAISRDGIYD